MPEPLQISVTSGSGERLSQRAQIEQVLELARAKGEPLRVRLPFTLYDQDNSSRGYVALRDATWNLALPSADLTPEVIEELIATIGVCITAVATRGSARVRALLQEETR